MNLRQKYFELTSKSPILLLVVLLAIFSGIMYLLVLNPFIKSYDKAKFANNQAADMGKLMDAKLVGLKLIGRKNTSLDAARMELMRANGNEVLTATQVSEFLDVMRDMNDRLGGRNFRIEEGPIESAYISLTGQKNIYKLMRLPVKITFESNYSAMSNYLFQIHSQKRLIKLGDIDVRAKGFTGDLIVTLNLGIYYTEES